MLNFRRAHDGDLDSIMAIVAQCQALMKRRGIDQWQNGYPSREVIENDIDHERGYLLEDDGLVAGYCVVVYTGEAAYDDLRGGEWLQEAPYVTIHRVAVSDAWRGCGVGQTLFSHMERQALAAGFAAVRTDTHEDNRVMLSLIQRLGYGYCGDVYYNGDKRVAYEKVLQGEPCRPTL